MKNHYTKFILGNMPRVLTQVDRDKDSKTYGSCDRNYWHLKIRDFSSAILQQTCLTLALIYKYDFEGNIYYNKPVVKEWAIAALKYLDKIQLKDGSFNEYYPNEHGFPPTAFILFAGSMTYLELELDDEEIRSSLYKAARWLSDHVEKNAYNQELASITGLYLFSKISYNDKLFKKMGKKLTDILEKQSEEGWFMEQGGADIGYLSVSLDMLSEYYSYSKDKRVIEPICRVIDFLQYFIHQDGTAGGEYGSRNTIYFMPNGLENVLCMPEAGQSSEIAMSMKKKLYPDTDKINHFMDAVDERYLSHYVMHSYLRANKKNKIIDTHYILPCENRHYKIFSNAGLVSMFNGAYHAIVSTKKGGDIKVYSHGEEKWLDCGYRSPIKPGTVATTNWLDQSYNIKYGKKIVISGRFNVITPKVQNSIYHLGLRLGAAILGDKVNKIIKKLTIFSDKHNDIIFERELLLQDEEISVMDKIKAPAPVDIYEADNHSLRLVASGKFFSISDLLITDREKYKIIKGLKISKKYNVKSHDLQRKVVKE